MAKQKQVTVRVDEKTFAKLAAIAKRDDRTIANVVRTVVEKMVHQESR